MTDLIASTEATYAPARSPSVPASAPREKNLSVTPRDASPAELGEVRFTAESDVPSGDVQRASERFGVALALSALTGVCAAPLLAHGSAVESNGMIGAGIACVVGAVVVQITERRRALATLIADGRARGLDPREAKSEAKTTLKRWLS